MGPATTLLEIIDRLKKLIRQESGKSERSCLLCEFGRMGQDPPHSFWSKLWRMLEGYGIEFEPIKEAMRAVLKVATDPCSAYDLGLMVKEIAKQLDAKAIPAQKA